MHICYWLCICVFIVCDEFNVFCAYVFLLSSTCYVFIYVYSCYAYPIYLLFLLDNDDEEEWRMYIVQDECICCTHISIINMRVSNECKCIYVMKMRIWQRMHMCLYLEHECLNRVHMCLYLEHECLNRVHMCLCHEHDEYEFDKECTCIYLLNMNTSAHLVLVVMKTILSRYWECRCLLTFFFFHFWVKD